MARLPVIVGFGGFNAAGRSSFHQSYQRIVLDELDTVYRQETLAGLAVMMDKVNFQRGEYVDSDGQLLSLADIEARYKQSICDETLIRPIGRRYFDVNKVRSKHSVALKKTEQGGVQFDLPRRNLPAELPNYWGIADVDERYVRVSLSEEASISLDSHYASSVQSAGQLPDGFELDELYDSRFHPRGLQLATIGASDAINSIGIDWQTILQHVSPDQVGAYSSSVMSQLDDNGFGGLLQARLNGGRASTKQLALGLGSMSSDFVNAYVLGNLGTTASIAGACASFLYNLRAGLEDIQMGRCRVVVVGSSEAPITPEIIEGYATMGALATIEKLCRLDGTSKPDLRRSSRPFGENCGFVIAESTQHVVLMDDELAMTLGADIYGAVTDVFIHGDGFKKSISAPGPGNYLTVARAVASARTLLGDESIVQRSFVQAHGSSTPQNRVTESEILDRVARTFGIENWPVTAVKAYLGHSLAPASGDQLMNTLGVFAHGILPGIQTIDGVADDVLQKHISIDTQHRQLDGVMDVAFLNSKGFGGNNATASIVSPLIVESMLVNRFGKKAMLDYQLRREKTQEQAQVYNDQYLQGNYQVIYKYGQNMLNDEDISIDQDHISIPGYGESIDLTKENLYKDMMESLT